MGKEASVYGQLPQAERILDEAARFYDRMIDKTNDPAVLLRAAKANNHMGSLYRSLGRHERAIQKHEAALALLHRTTMPRNRPDVLEARAIAYDGIGLAHAGRLYPTLAEPHFDQARAIWQQLADNAPNNAHYIDQLTGTLNSLAVVYMNTERLDEAENTYQRIVELSKRLPSEKLETAEQLNRMAGVNCNLGTLAVEKGRLAEAGPLFRDAIVTQEKVISLKPGVVNYQDDLYIFEWNLADLLVREGKHVEASAAAEKLVERFATRLQSYYEAADLLLRCAEAADAASPPLPLGDRPGEGGSAERQSINPPLPLGEGRGEGPLAKGPADSTPAESRKEGLRYRSSARQLIAAADQATERTPDSLQHFAWFLVMCRDESFRDPERALALADAGLLEAPQRAYLHRMRGIALYRLGQYQAAIDAFNRSASLLNGPEIVDTLFLAMAHGQLGHAAEAHKCYESGVEWFAQDQQKQPSVYDFLAAAHGEVLAEAGTVLGVDQAMTSKRP